MRIIIIGAGMAGLPGGVCTTWKRLGYKIDGRVHWLTGSAPGNGFYSLWKEVGVI